MRRRFVSLAFVAAVVVSTVTIAVPAATAAPPGFGCRASALRVKLLLLNLEPITSNAAQDPCLSGFNQALTIGVPGLLGTGIASAATNAQPTGATAAASVNNTALVLGGVSIGATVLSSNAAASCVNGVVGLSGGSLVAGLTINGVPRVIGDQPVTIPLGLLTIFVNERVVAGNTITTRALRVSAPLLAADIVVAESVAKVNRCDVPPKPQCSDGVDNADTEDTLADANDPGCHTDGNASNPASYDPNDNDESNPPECSDGVDNADTEDAYADANDPGCHRDGNALNPASYDPTDNTEANANECSDGKDNDGDGGIDVGGPHPDAQCASHEDALESV